LLECFFNILTRLGGCLHKQQAFFLGIKLSFLCRDLPRLRRAFLAEVDFVADEDTCQIGVSEFSDIIEP
jgi:hypothetical protein